MQIHDWGWGVRRDSPSLPPSFRAMLTNQLLPRSIWASPILRSGSNEALRLGVGPFPRSEPDSPENSTCSMRKVANRTRVQSLSSLQLCHCPLGFHGHQGPPEDEIRSSSKELSSAGGSTETAA